MERTVWLKNKKTGAAWEVEEGSELHERLRAQKDDDGMLFDAVDAPNVGNKIPDGKGGLIDLEKLTPDKLRALAIKKAEALPFVSIPDDATPEQLVAFLKN